MPAALAPSPASSSSPAPPPPGPLRFGEFVLDIANAQLSREGRVVDLPPKSFELLAFLAQRPGELVLKDTLLDNVWGRRFVSEGAVKTVVSELRAALGDDARAPRWVQTVQGRGYRFVGEVRRLPPAPASPGAMATARGNLPPALPPAIGRDEELAALAALVASHRLVTVVGTAGVGKTVLATTLAARPPLPPPLPWRDGAWLIELAPLDAAHTTPAVLCELLAHTLQLGDSAGSGADALAAALAGQSPLLVIDNAEHLLAVLAPLLGRLLAHLPGLRCLVTSREALQLPGEQVWRLGPLAVPAPGDEAQVTRLMACGALRLFVDRVAARLPGFVLTTAQQHPAAELCRALDGLPLALELAAARVPTLGIEGLAAQLAAGRDGEGTARLHLLTRGTRSAAPHQRTLRSTLDWSHALLAPEQQRVFRRLAVFRGGFTLEAAQQVCGDESLDDWGVLDALDALVAKSMLVAPEPDAAVRRFGLLQSLQDYAMERLQDSGEAEALRERHLEAVERYWARADARALGDPALAWVTRHAPDIDNLRAALAQAFARWSAARSDEERALRRRRTLALVGHTGLLWHRAGHAAEGLRWCRLALERAGPGVDADERAGIDLAIAHLAAIGMVLPAREGLAAARRAVDAFGWQADRVREYYALYLQHTLMCRAEPLADRSECLSRMDGLPPPGAGDLLLRFGRSARAYEARLQGRHEPWRAFNEQELARCRALGAVWEAWSAGIGLMLAEHDAGHAERAIDLGRTVLDEIRAAGRLRQNANRLCIWAMMLAQQGDTVATRAALPEVIDVARSGGRTGMALLPLAWLAWHEGRTESAARLLAAFDAPGRTGAEFGPGTYIRRSMEALWRRVEAGLDEHAIAACREAGIASSDEAAIASAMA